MEHAVWALRINPASHEALHLQASIKARKNLFLGVWWKWQMWMSSMDKNRRILVLLGMFVIYRIARQTALDASHPDLAENLQYAWLALCAYTWFGAALLKRSVQKELSKVKLKSGF